MTMKLLGRSVFSSAVVGMLLFFLPPIGRAQSMDVLVGVRGGFTSSSSPLAAGQNQYFPNRYSSRYSPLAWGPSVGVVLNDRFEIRVEAAKYRFHYSSQTGTPYPASGSKTSSVTDGHAWQFPILATYRLRVGSFRTFVGGGLGTRSIKSSVTATTTRIQFPNPTETTTLTTSTSTRSDGAIALHGSMGFEFRKRWISFRPEMRLGFWTGYHGDGEHEILGSPTQVEFIMGIRMHPFRVRD